MYLDSHISNQCLFLYFRCSTHGAKKAYECKDCGKSFATNADLERHKRNKTNKLYKCKVCGQQYAEKK